MSDDRQERLLRIGVPSKGRLAEIDDRLHDRLARARPIEWPVLRVCKSDLHHV